MGKIKTGKIEQQKRKKTPRGGRLKNVTSQTDLGFEALEKLQNKTDGQASEI